MLLTEGVEQIPANQGELNQAIAQFGPAEIFSTGLGFLLIMVIFFAPLFLAAIPAKIAKNKGRNYAGYYVFGYFALIPAIIVALILKPVEDKNFRHEKKMSDIIGRGKK